MAAKNTTVRLVPASAKKLTGTTAITEPTFRIRTAARNGGRTARANARPQPETRTATYLRYPVRTAVPAPTAAASARPARPIRTAT